jgi:glycosyltransferase involved in cell wall biosynthesis
MMLPRKALVIINGHYYYFPPKKLVELVSPSSVLVVGESCTLRGESVYGSRRSSEMIRMFTDQLADFVLVGSLFNDRGNREFSERLAGPAIIALPSHDKLAQLPWPIVSHYFSSTYADVVRRCKAVYVRFPSWLGHAFFELGKAENKPCIVSVHGNWSAVYYSASRDSDLSLLKRLVANCQASHTNRIISRVARRADAVCYVGEHLQNIYSPRDGRPELVFANYLLNESEFLSKKCLLKKFREAAGRTPRILFVGDLSSRKGLKYLLEAYKACLSKKIAADLWVVGSGPLCSWLKSEQQIISSEGEVKLFEYITFGSDLLNIYRDSDILVLSSVAGEGIPKVIGEAMSQGAAVLATDIGGTSEIVTDGENGLLVSPASSEALAAGLELLLIDPELRKRLALKALSSVKRMTNKSQRIKIRSFLEQILPETLNKDSAPHRQVDV